MRHLIINADGYGFTEGISRAIEECVDFGTVRSLSANANYPRAAGLEALVRRHPDLSVGCHLNPIVGAPVLPPSRVPTLVGSDGLFHYRSFVSKVRSGALRRSELRDELLAQVERTRALVGNAFSHVDFHMGLHRLPQLYSIFLEVAEASGTGRIRTHRYRVGMETRHPSLALWKHLLRSPRRGAAYVWNMSLRQRAKARGFAMPESWLEITDMTRRPERIRLENYLRLLDNVPDGFHEFVAHPAHVDEDLRGSSAYIDGREAERDVLLDPRFKEALSRPDLHLAGYRDIPLVPSKSGRDARGRAPAAGVENDRKRANE